MSCPTASLLDWSCAPHRSSANSVRVTGRALLLGAYGGLNDAVLVCAGEVAAWRSAMRESHPGVVLVLLDGVVPEGGRLVHPGSRSGSLPDGWASIECTSRSAATLTNPPHSGAPTCLRGVEGITTSSADDDARRRPVSVEQSLDADPNQDAGGAYRPPSGGCPSKEEACLFASMRVGSRGSDTCRSFQFLCVWRRWSGRGRWCAVLVGA